MTTFFINGEPQYWADGPPGLFVPLAEADALTAKIAAQEAALGSCREAFEGLEAERDGLRALIRRVQAMGDRLSDDEIYNRLADVYENGQSPELMQLLTDCQEALK